MFVALILVFFLSEKCRESAAQGLVQKRKGLGECFQRSSWLSS
jgi:hypothetical protein